MRDEAFSVVLCLIKFFVFFVFFSVFYFTSLSTVMANTDEYACMTIVKMGGLVSEKLAIVFVRMRVVISY